MNATVRLLTYNTAAGNPRVTTPQHAFLALPFYEEALAGAPDAPILALQEVGEVQSRALQRAAAAGRCRVLQARRPRLGNALVVPAGREVVAHARGWYPGAQIRGALDALRRRRPHTDWRQLGELRMWIEAHLHDRASGFELTVLTTHLSVEPALKVAQARAIAARARAAAARGPVILAGDLNLPARAPHGRDREAMALLRAAGLEDAALTEPSPGRPDIDRVLVAGLEAVSSRTWTDVRLSDHDPFEVRVRATSREGTGPAGTLPHSSAP
jgi:endonuclease/exonuclease/phosphatase family metal-dependent hydrolase